MSEIFDRVYPQKLDLNAWIEFSLYSNSQNDRHLALEELSSSGIPEYLYGKIRELSAEDSSEKCQKLAKWLISYEQCKIEFKQQVRSSDLSPESIEEIIQAQEPAIVDFIIQHIRSAPSEKILERWRNYFQSETTQTPLTIIGLNILAKYGKTDDIDFATVCTLDENPSVVCAALTLLQQQSKESFKNEIKTGLISKNPKVQMHAISLLRSIDPVESLKYVKSCLFHSNSIIRQNALRELLLIPFEKSKNIFMNYIARETNPLLLVKSGFMASFNPAPDLLPKLYEIILLSDSLKKHILQLVFNSIISSVKASGILNQSIDEFTTELKQNLSKKRDNLVVKIALRNLSNSDPNIRAVSIERLKNFSDQQEVTKHLTKHLETETEEELIKTIKHLVSFETQSKPSVALLEDFEAFKNLSFQAQKKSLSYINNNALYKQHLDFLLKVLDGDFSGSVKNETIRIVGQYGTKLDVRHISRFLKSSSPSELASTVKAAGTLDIDIVLPYLNGFLSHKDPRVKSAAFEIYVKADKNDALQYVSSMLLSQNSSSISLGLSLLPFLDYTSVEPIVIKLLDSKVRKSIKMQGCFIIASNPTPDGLCALYAFTHNKSGEILPDTKELWEMAVSAAVVEMNKSAEEIENECWESYKANEEQKDTLAPSYSYTRLASEDLPEQEDTKKTWVFKPVAFSEKLYSHFADYGIFYFAGIVSFLLVYYMIPVPPVPERTLSVSEPQTHFTATSDGGLETQVGSRGWRGTIRSPAVNIIQGDGYQTAIREGESQRHQLREDFRQHRRRFLTELANDARQDPVLRMQAAARLNTDFMSGRQAFEEQNYSNAQMFLDRVLSDPNANPLVKVKACQTLMEIATKNGDQQKFIQLIDRMGQEVQKIPGFENFTELDNFAENFGRFWQAAEAAADETQSHHLFTAFVNSGMSESEAAQRVEELQKTHFEFERMFKNK